NAHISELHRLAAEAKLPRYRLMKRDELLEALGAEGGAAQGGGDEGDGAPAAPAAPGRDAAPGREAEEAASVGGVEEAAGSDSSDEDELTGETVEGVL